ncbi:hypothetical protein [Marinitoga sp. 38H-ov]|uniref:hypothetical protein n=1 Tax=Marinitoga sp. 38H-ov TaxID=1755814 RepID=UPI0013EA13FA|nr:hypothetical protein [Marinitoga sp. 38H-ov]KAF2956688.1 hypothetical protein AS160_04720 [Marinitoga sp. 38H-ov]
MKEVEITVFVYSIHPFDAHISAEGVQYGITPENIHKIFREEEKPAKGVVVKFKLPDGTKKYIRAE